MWEGEGHGTCEETYKKVELSNADEKYRMNYSNMSSEILYKMRETHDEFLEKYLGKPYKHTIGATEYMFTWGKVCSFMDNKSGNCGILIVYNGTFYSETEFVH